MRLALIIAAGGRAERFGGDKLLAPLAGRPVLMHSLIRLQPMADFVIVAAPADRLDRYHAAVGGRARVVAGGAWRSQSVWRGLEALPAEVDFVAVHDAARPFSSRLLLQELLALARLHGGAIPAHRVTDTVKVVADGMVAGTVDRNTLAAIETPQVFNLELLRRAYALAGGEKADFTDEAALFEQAGMPVAVHFHQEFNPKITYPGDLELFADLASDDLQ